MKETDRGFIKWIALAIIALALLKYFLNWSVFDAAESDQGKSTIGYTRDILNLIWSYIASPVIFIWEKIMLPLIDIIWNAFQTFLGWGRDVSSTGSR
jgi:hypothetical protein